MSFQVGSKAPDFTLQGIVGNEFKSVTLSEYQKAGKWVVLFFYPLDFTFVCPTEIVAFSDRHADFKRLGAEVLGCSVDSQYTHLAWINTPRREGGLGPLSYPLLADLNKRVARDYGVLLEEEGVALRGIFIIDPDGIVQYGAVHNLGVGRSVDETLRVLEAFQHVKETGEVCPANWHMGEKTMIPDPAKSLDYFERTSK